MPNQVRNKIKKLRKKNGDTLRKLAEKINYDCSNLSKIERGLYEPSLSLLKKFSDVYGVKISYFGDQHNQASQKNSFTEGIDISSKEFFENYHFVLDEKNLSETELDLAIKIIRKFRIAVDQCENMMNC